MTFTPEWRQKGTDVRSKRVEVRLAIQDGELSVTDVIADPPDELKTLYLYHALQYQQGWGARRASLCCSRANVQPYVRLCDLKVRERLAVIEALG